jgi:hypothetical protein
MKNHLLDKTLVLVTATILIAIAFAPAITALTQEKYGVNVKEYVNEKNTVPKETNDMSSDLFDATNTINSSPEIIGNDKQNWPPSHYDVEFLPRVNVVHSSSNTDTQYYFLAGIPMTVFHHNSKVYQSLLITDQLTDKPTQYIINDWATYLSGWGGAQHINFIGDVPISEKNTIRNTYGITWEYVTNITGTPIVVANQIAAHDWKNSEYVVIAPYIPSLTAETDIESISNAAAIAALYNAPLLFTNLSSLSPETLAVISDVEATKAIIVEIGNTIGNQVNTQLQTAGLTITNDLTTETMVVSLIRSITGKSTLCSILRNWQNLPAALSAARYGGYVLFLPDTIQTKTNTVDDIIKGIDSSYYKLTKPVELPKDYKTGEEAIAQTFYTWLTDIGGNDPDKLETVTTFNTQPYYDSANGFSVTFERAISGDPSMLTNPGAVSGRMPLQYIGNIALANRDGMYRATIFSNPRPKHVTLAMNAYEVWHAVDAGGSYNPDNWGQNHVVNEIFGYPYRGWCSANGYFPWQDIHDNPPGLVPILPPGPGAGPDCDPGQFASFNDGYEAHFHSGANAGSGSHPSQPSVPNCGFVADMNTGSAFLYFSCHGGGTSIAVRTTDNGVAQDSGDQVAWGASYWPSTDGRVYDGSAGGSYSQDNLNSDLGNVHGAMTAYNACDMAEGKMNEVLLEHGGSNSLGSYTSVSFIGSGWWWNMFVHLITHENYTVGETAAYATARVADLFTPGSPSQPNADTSLQYVVFGDPNMQFVQSGWTSPEPVPINVYYGGHKPDKPPRSFIVTITPTQIPVGITSIVHVNVKDDVTLEPVVANVSIEGWGVSERAETNTQGNISFTLTPPYGENLTLTVAKEDYDSYDTMLGVTGGIPLIGEITACVPSLGVTGVLAPTFTGIINGTSSNTNAFTLRAKGCGIDSSASTTTGFASLSVIPVSGGIVSTALLQPGYRVLSCEIPVLTLHLGIRYSPTSLTVDQTTSLAVTVNCTEAGTLLQGVLVKVQGCGIDASALTNTTGVATLVVTPNVDGSATIHAEHSGFESKETSIPVTKANMTVETLHTIWVHQQLPICVWANNSVSGAGVDDATITVYGCGIGITSYTETGSLTSGEHRFFNVVVGGGATYLSGYLTWVGTADIDMKLYDPAHTLIDSSTSTTPSEFVETNNPQSGTWQIEVYSYSGATSSFTLVVTIEYGAGATGVTENGLATIVIQPKTTGTITVSASKPGYNNAATTIQVVTGPTGSINGTVSASVIGQNLGNVTVKLYNSSVDPLENKPAFETLTNQNGHYNFSNIPIGEYLILTWKFGYELQQDIVQILEGQTIVHNVALTPAQHYTVQGYVRDTNTNELLNATVTIFRNDTGEQITSVSTTNGHYLVQLIPYTYRFRVASAHHLPLEMIIMVSGNISYNFGLVPALFSDDIESGADGWTHTAAAGTDLWHISQRRYQSASHAWYCGSDSTGNYLDNMDDSLVTPSINLMNMKSAVLTFGHYYNFESSTSAWDGSDVEISVNSGRWQQITPQDGYDDTIYASSNAAFPTGTPVFAHSSNGWQEERFDLSSFVDSTVQIRFRFGSDSSIHSYEGWYIDDVAVYGELYVPLPDLTVTSIGVSNEHPWVGDTITINASIFNGGDATASNVAVRFVDVRLGGSETTIGTAVIPTIGIGALKTASVSWITTAGYHTIKVLADPDNTINEHNETNNILTRELIVGSSNIPPLCSIAAPVTGSSVNGIVTISGEASDPDGTVESVWVKIGNDSWHIATGTTAWQYLWDTTTTGNGFYDVQARSYDGEMISSTDVVLVTVDNFVEEYYLQWSHNYGSSTSDARYQGAQPIGDADNDGQNELLIGGRDGELHVMKWNTGASTYVEQAVITEPTGGNPGGFSVADVDNDGLNEIAVAWDYQFSAFQWTGSTYARIGSIWDGDGTDNTYDCFVGDFDNDNKNEVILVDDPSSGHPEITVLAWNSAVSNFYEKTSWNYPGGDVVTPMAWIADVDVDGANEIVCVPGYDLVVLNWNGASFTATTLGSFSYETYACVCGDANGNGIPEIAVGLYAPQGYVYEWNGNLYQNIWSRIWSGEEAVIEAVAIGDSDGDGAKEIAFGTNLVHILQWTGSTYAEEALLPTAGMLAPLAIGDCDGDGQNEVSVGNVADPPYMQWVFKHRHGNPPTCTILSPLNGSTVGGTVTITGSASDAQTVEAVYVRIDNTEWQQADLLPKVGWTVQWDTTTGENGWHTIYAGAYNGQRYSPIDIVRVQVMNQRGDCNGDGVIDVGDVVYLINYLFIHGPAPVPLISGDVNSDGVVDVSDVVYLINYLFINGPPPGV